jgi:hypothetical protein
MRDTMKQELVGMLFLGALGFAFMVAFVATLWKLRESRSQVAYLIDLDIKAQDARHDHQYRCEICHKTPEQVS